MAVTLSIDLTDTEQSKLESVAAIVAPGATPAQIKAWAEATAKAALRQAVVDRWHEHLREQENTARQVDDAGWSTNWASE